MNCTLVPLIKHETFSETPANALALDLSHNNWEEEFPYSPIAKVWLWHNEESLFLNFEVEEKFVAANAKNDNDKVSKDSCVELFIAFDNSGYYNLEANCAGKILLSHRKARKVDVNYAPQQILAKINRIPSLGKNTFECKRLDEKWCLRLEIPAEVFFKHDFKNLSGVKAKCNLYKCGDELPEPHYLSWQPIMTDKPDFHRPEFFSPICFE